jgi:hypothetical protein
MKTISEHIRENLFTRRGMKTDGSEYADNRRLNMKELVKTQWSHDFECFQRNRLIFGAFRYGVNFQGVKEKGKYDRMGYVLHKTQIYIETGNLECLVDIANSCMLEFVEGEHPKKHFTSEDDGFHYSKKGT